MVGPVVKVSTALVIEFGKRLLCAAVLALANRQPLGELQGPTTDFTSIDKLPIRNLYYNQEFSYEELDKIIECISLSDTLDEKTAKKLIKKVKAELGTIYYEEKSSCISKIEPEMIVDSEYYRGNIKTIEEAIENNVKVTFYYNGIDCEKKLERESLTKEIISPYYLVANFFV